MYGNTHEEEQQYPEDVAYLFMGDEEEYWMLLEEELSEF